MVEVAGFRVGNSKRVRYDFFDGDFLKTGYILYI